MRFGEYGLPLRCLTGQHRSPRCGHWPWSPRVNAASADRWLFYGAFVASPLTTVSERWRPSRVFSLVAALIAVALAMSWKLGDAPAMEVLAAAMGAQNATRLADPSGRLGLTYVTGQLYASARDLALRLARERRTSWLMPVLMWAALLIGAAAGSLAHMALGTKALAVPLLGLAYTCARPTSPTGPSGLRL